MGYMVVLGPCYACKRLFSFNPDWVPSITPPGGTREPICRDCIETKVNPLREARGLPPVVTHPMAYEPQEVA